MKVPTIMCDLLNLVDFSIDLPNDYENWELQYSYKWDMYTQFGSLG
jgi:hypothetical protein